MVILFALQIGAQAPRETQLAFAAPQLRTQKARLAADSTWSILEPHAPPERATSRIFASFFK